MGKQYDYNMDNLGDDDQLKELDIPLCDSDEESDKYYSDYESDIESLTFKHMSSPWFSYICEGTKTWDVRLKKDYWDKIKVGEPIYYNGDVNNYGKVCCMKIIDIKMFDNFTDLIKEIPLQKIMPHIASDNDAILLFRKWYNEDDERKHKVIAINLGNIY